MREKTLKESFDEAVNALSKIADSHRIKGEIQMAQRCVEIIKNECPKCGGERPIKAIKKIVLEEYGVEI